MTKRTALVLGLVCVLGAVSVGAGAQVFEAILDGASESPPNASPGTGFATVTLDLILNTLGVDVTFSGLLGTTTASHIHAATALPDTGTAGVATAVPTFTGFPLGVTSGSYSHTFDLTLLSSYNPAYVTANGGTAASAESALAAAMVADKSYLNVHSTFRPGGEIRGFLQQVPEPSGLPVALAGGLSGLWVLARKRRR